MRFEFPGVCAILASVVAASSPVYLFTSSSNPVLNQLPVYVDESSGNLVVCPGKSQGTEFTLENVLESKEARAISFYDTKISKTQKVTVPNHIFTAGNLGTYFDVYTVGKTQYLNYFGQKTFWINRHSLNDNAYTLAAEIIDPDNFSVMIEIKNAN